MSDQQHLRERREALVQAVNRHDMPGVLSFIHPSFSAKTKWGSTVGYKDVVPMMEQLLGPESNYQETVEIETIEVSGESATVVTRRGEQIERGHVQGRPRGARPMIVLAIFFAGMALLYLVHAARGREGAVGTLVAYAVGSVAALCWEFYLRRSVHRTKRYQELWRLSDGRWMIISEQEI